MSGLILKDIRLLSKQKKLAVLYVIVAVMLSFSMDTTFLVAYFSMIGALLVITTLSYDSFDNGYPFLMTLPVEPKTYAYAKYAFSFLGLLAFWAASVVLQFITLSIRKISFEFWDTILSDLIFFPVFLLIIALMIPISLKFGSEKARIVILIIGAACFAIGYFAKSIMEKLVTDDMKIGLGKLITKLQTLPQNSIVFVCLGASLLILLISMMISAHVIKNKEF